MRQNLILLGLISTVAATVDKNYNASLPFRPTNVTGLSELTTWVGSYYNATTKLELIPLLGETVNQSRYPVCPNVGTKPIITEYESFLAVTERGSYNIGHNPVNTLLTLWKPGTNYSSFSKENPVHPFLSYPFLWSSPSLEWYIESSPWVLQDLDTPLDSDIYGSLYDIYNLTLQETTKQPYNLTGSITPTYNFIQPIDITYPACNTSTEKNKYSIQLLEGSKGPEANWNWTAATVNLLFDSTTANFTVSGYFEAISYMLANSSNDPNAEELGPVGFEGEFKLSFAGVIDRYHSDVLKNDTDTPTWIRTVGFNNNSVNIGFSEAGRLSRPGWVVSFVSLVLGAVWYM